MQSQQVSVMLRKKEVVMLCLETPPPATGSMGGKTSPCREAASHVFGVGRNVNLDSSQQGKDK